MSREHFPGKSETEAKTLALAIAIVTLASDMPFLARQTFGAELRRTRAAFLLWSYRHQQRDV